ncbi:hypothetical protein F4778DRAFT_739247 [Xylariomycetidae sp. FL2044]|nr:hypothetical protein F4778DRAFT_739247 [Xylariomycetidae sp. FL2044]
MTTAPLSPKRRHIFSSINPDYQSNSTSAEETSRTPEAPPQQPEETEQATQTKERKTSKFRFKSESSRSHRSSRHRDRDYDDERDGERDHGSSHRHRHHHRRRRHHHHKRPRTRSRSPTPPNPYEPPALDSEAAFRESLFDAMADDEGAAYWEGVYGQPIHVYSQERATGPQGELECMDDDEYATFVRQKMWEKTHQGLLEERARREERRRQRDKEEQEAARLTREMERSLRKGEERRKRRGWRDKWEAYGRAWGAWDGAVESMAWPVGSGRREDIGSETVRDFFVMGIDPEEVGEAEFVAKLKEERVRWHPDKIQQRLGGKVDQAVMRDVTAVFQIVDQLWSDTRARGR